MAWYWYRAFFYVQDDKMTQKHFNGILCSMSLKHSKGCIPWLKNNYFTNLVFSWCFSIHLQESANSGSLGVLPLPCLKPILPPLVKPCLPRPLRPGHPLHRPPPLLHLPLHRAEATCWYSPEGHPIHRLFPPWPPCHYILLLLVTPIARQGAWALLSRVQHQLFVHVFVLLSASWY